MPDLVELFSKLPTDKSQFAEIYTDLIGDLEITRLLEIGVDQGFSIMGWLEAFPLAVVEGVDIRPSGLQHPRYQEWTCDVNSLPRDFFQSEKKFDVIIDDGSHKAADIINTFERLWDLVKPGGYYFVEDTQIAQRPDYSNGVDIFAYFVYKNPNNIASIKSLTMHYSILYLRKSDG